MPNRKAPAHQGNRRLPEHRANGYHESSGDYRHQAPTLADRHEMKLIEELQLLGYGITVPCLVCGHALSSKRSLALMVGPKCRAKAVTE